ncbi:MAG: hypothetical protein ABH851_04805 [Methanobacteriota archaeon]
MDPGKLFNKRITREKFANFKGYDRFLLWTTSHMCEEDDYAEVGVVKPEDVHPRDIVFTDVMLDKNRIEHKAELGLVPAQKVLEAAGSQGHRSTELRQFGIELKWPPSGTTLYSPKVVKPPILEEPDMPNLIRHYKELFEE